MYRLTIEVILDGEYLLGDSSFTLEPKARRPYQVIYSPLIPKTHGGAITFLNPKVRARTNGANGSTPWLASRVSRASSVSTTSTHQHQQPRPLPPSIRLTPTHRSVSSGTS
jgi:hypothetical protein